MVNFIQTRQRQQYEPYTEKKMRKFTRRMTCDSESENDSETEDPEREIETKVCRLPTKQNKTRNTVLDTSTTKVKRFNHKNTDCDTAESKENESLQRILGAIAEFVTSKMSPKKKRDPKSSKCYACQQQGHFARECPNISGQQTRETRNHQPGRQSNASGNVVNHANTEAVPLNYQRLPLVAKEKPTLYQMAN